nr:MAG TPA: hypothetical protein [Caudoviricetes sp.]
MGLIYPIYPTHRQKSTEPQTGYNTQKQAIAHHKHIKVYVKHSKPFINKVKIFLYFFSMSTLD